MRQVARERVQGGMEGLDRLPGPLLHHLLRLPLRPVGGRAQVRAWCNPHEIEGCTSRAFSIFSRHSFFFFNISSFLCMYACMNICVCMCASCFLFTGDIPSVPYTNGN